MRHFHLSDVHDIEVRAKDSVVRSWRRFAGAMHSNVVNVSREYCHLIYFGGVFIEGHGIYPWAAGVLFVLSVVAMVVGEGIDEVE